MSRCAFEQGRRGFHCKSPCEEILDQVKRLWYTDQEIRRDQKGFATSINPI